MRRLLRLCDLVDLCGLRNRCAGSPSFKFGDGIGFTTFGYTLEPASPPRANVSVHELEAYSQAATTQHMFTRASPLAGVVHTVRVRVRNTGSVAGAHTVLAFVSPPRYAAR